MFMQFIFFLCVCVCVCVCVTRLAGCGIRVEDNVLVTEEGTTLVPSPHGN